jgi:hypothetical protein
VKGLTVSKCDLASADYFISAGHTLWKSDSLRRAEAQKSESDLPELSQQEHLFHIHNPFA